MARITSNRLIEDLDTVKRTTKTNGPAVESENARLSVLGAFRQDAVAINQAGVALTYQGVDANARIGTPAMRAGVIKGISWQLSAAITAGVATLQVTVGGTGTGDAISLVSTSTTSAVVDESVDISFNEGDILGVKVTTNGSTSPATSKLSVELAIHWAS